MKVCFALVAVAMGDVGARPYHAGSGPFTDIEAVTPEQFEAVWRAKALSGLA